MEFIIFLTIIRDVVWCVMTSKNIDFKSMFLFKQKISVKIRSNDMYIYEIWAIYFFDAIMTSLGQ